MSTRRFGARAFAPKTQLLFVASAALAVAIVLGGVLIGRSHGAVDRDAPASKIGATAAMLRLTPVQWSNLDLRTVQSASFHTEVTAEGSIAVNDDTATPVFSPYSGRVTQVLAKPGDSVKKGAPLFMVDAAEIVQAQNDLAGALLALSTTNSQSALADRTEKRQHDLYDAKAGALKDWQQSQADLIAAKNAAATAEIALAAVRNRLRILGKSDFDIGLLERAAMDHRMTAEAAVTAPISGIVTQRQVGVGQYIASVTAGATSPLYVLGNLSSVWLVAYVRESDARFMKAGQPVEVRVAAYPERKFSARIAWVAPALDSATHRLPVRAVIDNRDGILKPSMFAGFSIAVSDTRGAPAVPGNAIVYDGDAARVWVAQDDRTVTSRPVRIGREHDGMIEVLAGLAAGEKVVASGTLFIDRAAKSDDQGGAP